MIPGDGASRSDDPRPIVYVSRCLGFAACRWDGAIIPCPAVAELAPHVTLRPVCPELEMGLGVPRDPIRIVGDAEGARRLAQPATGRDLTADMAAVVARRLAELSNADGLILKGRSPSCGLRDARVYASAAAETPEEDAARGMFAAGVLARLPHLAASDDVGLLEPARRHHWLTRIFASARLRAARAKGSRAALVRYQTENKLLLMAHDKRRLGALGRLVATVDVRPLPETWDRYAAGLYAALAEPARPGGHTNTLMHALGYLREELSRDEKRHFLDLIARFRDGREPLSACLSLMRAWISRSDEGYLAQQTYWWPYPAALERAL